MNRQKLARLVSLLTVVTIGAVTYTVYLPDTGVTLADLADAGAATPTHALTCPVRVSAACQARFGVGRYEWVQFGAVMDPLVGSSRDVLFPPLGAIRQCVELMDFQQCTAVPCASAAAVCAKFGNANPFTLAAGDRKCVRRNTARGYGACRFGDGGVPRELLVYPSARMGSGCESLGVPQDAQGCYVIAGDNAEDL
jgi:hypothetical protein